MLGSFSWQAVSHLTSRPFFLSLSAREEHGSRSAGKRVMQRHALEQVPFCRTRAPGAGYWRAAAGGRADVNYVDREYAKHSSF